ncbi:MAG: SUMF1/EgtB/PvdO family nonheme iron enzyme [Chitinispirillales bacterium]|jgi:uncharacterized protein (TIGR02145 family)|nr:SUMF1/EgtB/PvdO family nonheme iron enzyme [Chitinispirillales bacterium]
MKPFYRHRQALLIVAAVSAVIAAGCVKKVTAPAEGAADGVAAEDGCAAADILFESTDPAGALSFTDSRDCQKYRAVKIGGDIWMARNLNYEADDSWCSGDADSNCVKFGRLYDWDVAQTVCPAGWHLPGAEEWDSLVVAAGGKRGAEKEGEHGWDRWVAADKKLKAKYGWKTYKGKDGSLGGPGTDDFGFSALAGGERYGGGDYMEPGESGTWWTSKENNGSSAYRMEMLSDFSFVGTSFKEEGFSVRCVSDDGVIVKAGERGSFTLTLTAGSGGALTASPRKDSYAAGEKVTLTATPENGHAFAGWTGGRAADSADLVTVITVLSDTAVSAKFRRIDYGALTDVRDGKEYKTVKIGSRTWMAENLDYKPAEGVSSCLGEDAGNCEKYGRLYDWDAAQDVCPAGWQLPSFDDWNSLAVHAGSADIVGKKLKAASGWTGDGGYRGKGTDDYGFSALPGGGEPKRFENYNIFGAWWTTTKMYGDVVNARLTLHQDRLSGLATEKSDRYSVRCIMDEGGTLTLNALEGGTVSSSPRKTSFKAGETAAITATPKSGYVFSHWSGGKAADPTAAVTTVAVRSNMEITAHFRAAPGASGTLADKRDGQKYRTTQIGNQVWTAQNLNYKTGNSWCYNDSDSYCKTYGRLYDWNAAKTACPAGWHLPSSAEWDVLTKAAGGKKRSDNDDDNNNAYAENTLKAKTGWKAKTDWNRDNHYNKDGNSTDDYGFSALPGGGRLAHDDDNPFKDAGGNGVWWTATEAEDNDNAYVRGINGYTDELIDFDTDKDNGFSARCVMDGVNKPASAQKAKRAASKGGKPEIEMVFVKGGTFKMGYPDGEDRDLRYASPLHNVTLGDFYIGKYEITQKQWMAVMDGNPSGGAEGDDYPVNNISWYDMQEFIERLNAATGKNYRLPTEAEWEYAARGGANGKGYKYSGGDNPDDVAWHEGNSGGETHPVGTKAPNELGLYDMTGNVWESVGDWMRDYGPGDQTNPTSPQEGTVRVGRGCYWGGRACRVYDRGYYPPGGSSYDTGFRLVLPPYDNK